MAVPEPVRSQSRNSPEQLGVTPPEKRIRVLDVIRGFAIFGILVSNMSGYSYPSYYLSDWGYHWGGLVNKLAWELTTFAVIGKFLTIFSFLFGLGFALQLQRAEARSQSVVPIYTRRLVVLFLFGAVHAFLIWYGDILLLYSAAGFVLLLSRNAKPKTLLACFVLLFCASFAKWEFRLAQQYAHTETIQKTDAGEENSPGASGAKEMARASAHAYAEGTYAEMVAQRVRDVYFSYGTTYLSFAHVLSLYLLGFYAGRRKVFQDIEAHAALFRRIAMWGFFLGVAGQTGLHYLSLSSLPRWMILLRPVASAIGVVSLAAFYVASLVLLSRNEFGERVIRPLAAVGRMAVSNYILQSLVCTTLFYSYGLRLYGRMGPAAGLALAIGIYAGQILLSNWWLRRFRFGPLEWLWRTLTYGHLQAFRA